MNTRQMAWWVRTNDFKKSEFSVEVIEVPKKKLMMAAAKKAGLMWVLAALFVLIPGLHFVLVPLFFILGFGVFFSQMKKTHYLEHGFYVCPECQKPVYVKNFYFEDHQKLRCDLCGTQLVLIQNPIEESK